MKPSQGPSLPVEISAIGANTIARQIETTDSERAALAVSLSLLEISALSAEINMRRDGKGIIHLDGRFHADIVQSCVVSLEPVRQTIDESIELRLATEQENRQAPKPEGTSGAVDIDPVGDDPPETVSGPVIDIGAVLIEHLILAIEPYPRASGAVLLDNPAQDVRESGDSPFAGLAGLVRPEPER